MCAPGRHFGISPSVGRRRISSTTRSAMLRRAAISTSIVLHHLAVQRPGDLQIGSAPPSRSAGTTMGPNGVSPSHALPAVR